ncbi:MAG: NADP-dependent malic enzyme, partial [Bacteroidota bacterium]
MNDVEKALDYHRKGRKGKIELTSPKPFRTQKDLSLAYTPGVAEPCRRITENPEDVYEYTARGNLVGVVTNGTAVLGLGNIGPLASKPVMEGKAVLFKMFADIDAMDLEIKTEDPFEFINIVRNLEPTFGGINLEDIKSPDCFVIEDRLRKEMKIPVFHDDQHGTAIISAAALLNALEIAGKDIGTVRIVINGAGAAAIACGRLYRSLGAKPNLMMLCDRQGAIYKGRPLGMNIYKEEFAV